MGWVWKSLSAGTAGIRKRVSKGCPVVPRTEGGKTCGTFGHKKAIDQM